MAYRGKAPWEPIAELKACLPVPVIGNGDVTTPALARQMLTETGCDAVMIGRGAKTNPWIFSWRERSEVPPAEVYGLICYQYRAMQPYYPNGAVLPFRKFLKAYLEPYALPNNRLQAILTAKQEDQLFKQLDHLFLELGVLNLNAAREVFDTYMQNW